MTVPTFPLNDGTELPAVGLGTLQMKGDAGITAIEQGLRAGYRLLDTAVSYGNEPEVGQAVARSGVQRAEIRITSKIRGRDHEYVRAVQSAHDSVATLGVDQLDVLLIHWPNPSVGKYVDAWRALVDLQRDGTVATIGVSNFGVEHLDRILDATGVAPAVNQLEVHPYFPQDEMIAENRRRGILTQAWSPLGKQAALLAEAPIRAAAEAHGVTPAQAVLRWQLQRECLPIPKSADPGRQRENLDLAGFELTEQEMSSISALRRAAGRRFGGDPKAWEEL